MVLCLMLHLGLDLDDFDEWEGLVGECRRCEGFTVQRGKIKREKSMLRGLLVHLTTV